jgi:hypothetical protein
MAVVFKILAKGMPFKTAHYQALQCAYGLVRSSPQFCRSQSMANEPQSAESPSLSATVVRCLTILQSLSLALDTYGNEDHAAMLHEVIAQLQKAVPAQSGSEPDSMDFVVNATFKVSRRQVANTLSCAFGSQITRFRVAELSEPPAF